MRNKSDNESVERRIGTKSRSNYPLNLLLTSYKLTFFLSSCNRLTTLASQSLCLFSQSFTIKLL